VPCNRVDIGLQLGDLGVRDSRTPARHIRASLSTAQHPLWKYLCRWEARFEPWRRNAVRLTIASSESTAATNARLMSRTQRWRIRLTFCSNASWLGKVASSVSSRWRGLPARLRLPACCVV